MRPPQIPTCRQLYLWCLRLDLNQRPFGHEPNALSSWAVQANKKYELDHSHPTVLFHTPKPCPSVIFNWWLLEVPTLPSAGWEPAILATRRKSHIDIFYFLLYIYYTIFFNKNQKRFLNKTHKSLQMGIEPIIFSFKENVLPFDYYKN